MSRLNFKLEAVAPGSRARAARFRTLHNEVLTPLFMPVGTRATVRHQQVEGLMESGSQILLANTYHLLLRPGPEVFRHYGGIHRFKNWTRSVLTDSGGFQIFSLPNARKMTEEGASFQSYVDGSTHLLSPEKSIEMQRAIGSDIMMVLDQCVPSTVDYATAKQAMDLTHRWAKRSLAARGDSPQSMFGIIQGACFRELRKASAEALTEFPFDGFAIGGLAVGETKDEREDFTEFTTALMPAHLPRYLMGVGTPIDLLEAVHRGVDMFDCIIPTALAEQGVCYTSLGRMRLGRGVYRLQDVPLDPNCKCHVCRNYTRGYMHHLVKSNEPAAASLIGQHNVAYYHQLMREMRSAILDGSFMELYRERREIIGGEDTENPSQGPTKATRKPKALNLGDYEIHVSAEGFASLRQKSSGEIMHSVSRPDDEAARLYTDQSRIVERVLEHGEELVVWDVGLGGAHNAMATIRALEALAEDASRTQGFRAVRIVSFENDLDSLRLALSHPKYFKHLFHPGPPELLKNGRWISKKMPLSWDLLEGDFLHHIEAAPAPDLIYYDPFSAKVDSPLWTLETFRRVHGRCAPKATELFTYSASTAVRSTLLGAGFYVARGAGTPPKAETTIGLMRPQPTRDLLGAEWLSKWERSDAQGPLGERPANWETLIRQHPQFRSV